MPKRERNQRAIRVNAVLKISFREIENDSLSSAPAVNISEAGLCIPLTHRPTSSFLELRIHSADFKAPMTATARIAWIIDRDDAEFPFEAGLEFLILGPTERDLLQKYVKRSADRGGAPEIRWIDAGGQVPPVP